MSLFVPVLAAWLRTHHGVVSRAKLLEFGLSPSAIKTLVASGELIVVHEGVYRHAACPDTLWSRCGAICAADPQLVICCGGAVKLWEYRRCTSVGLHVTSTAPGRTIDDGTVVHRCPLMPAAHVHHRNDGIRVTSPARTIFDLAKHVGPDSLESVIEQGLRRSQFDVPALYDIGRLSVRARAGRLAAVRPRVDIAPDVSSSCGLASRARPPEGARTVGRAAADAGPRQAEERHHDSSRSR